MRRPCEGARRGILPKPPPPDKSVTVRYDHIPRRGERHDGVSARHQARDRAFGARAIGEHDKRGAGAHANPVQRRLIFVGDVVERFEKNEVAVSKLVGVQVTGGGDVDVDGIDIEARQQTQYFIIGMLTSMQKSNLGWGQFHL